MFLKRDPPVIDENFSVDAIDKADMDSPYESDSKKMCYSMELDTESQNVLNGSYLGNNTVDDANIVGNESFNLPRRESFRKRYGRTSKPDADLLSGACG